MFIIINIVNCVNENLKSISMNNINPLIEEELNFYFPKFLSKIHKDSEEYHALETGIKLVRESDLSHAKLNQLLHLCSYPGISHGFFKYYFLSVPSNHPYQVEKLAQVGLDISKISNREKIEDVKQLKWGLDRIMQDALLFFGNFLKAYQNLRIKTFEELVDFFSSKSFDREYLISRGKIETPKNIAKDDRYLISEMACKTYEDTGKVEDTTHVRIALKAFRQLKEDGGKVTAKTIKKKAAEIAAEENQGLIIGLLLEETDETIDTEEEVVAIYSGQYETFKSARRKALLNTKLYLSIINDLDIYIATSMRIREDFREVATMSERIFKSDKLSNLNLRFFDPTLSAANHHEDKGLIECLMVKKSKALLYFAQHKESLGKVSEYAMALSLGKPVIIICPEDKRGKELHDFYLNKHPLLRLVEFNSGVVNGSIITNSIDIVIELIYRLFNNEMEFKIEKKENREAYYLLKEILTGSTYRIITDDRMLTEAFWNYYNLD